VEHAGEAQVVVEDEGLDVVAYVGEGPSDEEGLLRENLGQVGSIAEHLLLKPV
jgi:hypothetical protein